MGFILENVNKRFIDNGKDLEILKDINLTINDGEFLSVVGPSGCGKTTILRMIAGLDFPTSGTITENNIPVTGPSTNRGFVFQQYSLFPWRNVLDNVAFGLEIKGFENEQCYKRARKYIEMVGLYQFEEAIPTNYLVV
ncbi:MAG: ATP-binding cassette domain-containing protein [Methanobacterium sp.]|nr:ATP-binding cassette domain-containing protein [Methanobacterium sp.]